MIFCLKVKATRQAKQKKIKKNYDIKKTCWDELPPHLIYMFEGEGGKANDTHPLPPTIKKKIIKKIHLLSQLTTMFDFLIVGEGGKAVVIDKDKLSPEEKKKFDDGWQKNAFNQYASDMISLHRSLPDVRDPE